MNAQWERQIMIRFQYEKFYNRYDQDANPPKKKGIYVSQRAQYKLSGVMDE